MRPPPPSQGRPPQRRFPAASTDSEAPPEPPSTSPRPLKLIASSGDSEDSSEKCPDAEKHSEDGTVPRVSVDEMGQRKRVAVYKLEGQGEKAPKKKSNGIGDLLSSRNRAMAESELTVLQRVVHHRLFETVSTILVLLSALLLGAQVQVEGKLTHKMVDEGETSISVRELLGFTIAQCVFTAAFTVELGIRWGSIGCVKFFTKQDTKWHVFDCAAVGFSILDAGLSAAQSKAALNSASLLRTLRLVRIVRLARVFRLARAFKELRVMVLAILRSLKLLCWAVMILFTMVFIFGISLTTGFMDYVQTNPSDIDFNGKDKDLVNFFGTLDCSILHLYMCITSGRDWSTYWDALAPLSAAYRVLFLCYIAFSIIAVMNIVTGIFVDSAVQCGSADRDTIVEEEIQNRKEFLDNLRAVFEEIDEDGSGLISMAEFEDKLGDDRVVAYLQSLQLNVADAKKLFMLLDHEMSGEIDLNAFLQGCQRLKGESRALDQAMMMFDLNFLTEFVRSWRSDQMAQLAQAPPILQHRWNGVEASADRIYTRRASADRIFARRASADGMLPDASYTADTRLSISVAMHS